MEKKSREPNSSTRSTADRENDTIILIEIKDCIIIIATVRMVQFIRSVCRGFRRESNASCIHPLSAPKGIPPGRSSLCLSLR